MSLLLAKCQTPGCLAPFGVVSLWNATASNHILNFSVEWQKRTVCAFKGLDLAIQGLLPAPGSRLKL